MFGIAPYTPAVPPLIFWIDASVATITGIKDMSGINNLMTTAVSAPTISNNQFNRGVKAGINFVSAGSNQFNLANKIILNNGYSIFITFNCATVGSGVADAKDVPFVMAGDTTTSIANFGLDGNNVAYCYNSTEIVGTGGNAADGNNHTIALSHNINKNVRLYLDGKINKTGTSSTYNQITTAFNCIGQGANAGDTFNNGNIAEVLIWNGAIDDSVVLAYHERALALWI